jgi:hypothetical protein
MKAPYGYVMGMLGEYLCRCQLLHGRAWGGFLFAIGVVSEGEKQGWGRLPSHSKEITATIARLDTYITIIATKIWILL